MSSVLLAFLVFVLDHLTKRKAEKELAYEEEKPSATGRLLFHRMDNEGFALGILKDKPNRVLFVTGIASLFILIRFLILLPQKGKGLLKTGYALLCGGAFGNLWDRFRKGSVTDFLKLRTGIRRIDNKIFNVADLAVFSGSFLIAIGSLFKERDPYGTDEE